MISDHQGLGGARRVAEMNESLGRQAQNPLVKQMENGERVLWEGKPEKTAFLLFTPPWFFYFLPFFTIWVGFGIGIVVWLVAHEEAENQRQNLVLFLLYTAIGLYLGFIRFPLALREWRNTFYLLTERRALMQKGILRPHISAMDLRDMTNVRVAHHRRSGVGSIDFGSGSPSYYIPGWPSIGAALGPAFLAIENAHEVQETIRQARERQK